MLTLDVGRTRSFTERVNCEVQRAMSGGPPSTWAVFPRGTVVLFPEDAVFTIDCVDAESILLQRVLVGVLRRERLRGKRFLRIPCSSRSRRTRRHTRRVRETLAGFLAQGIVRFSQLRHSVLTLRQDGLEQKDTATKQLLSNLFKK